MTTKQKTDFLWYTIRSASHGGGVDVHGFKEATTGVLKGQTIKTFIDSFETEQEAFAAFPDAKYGSKFTDPVVSLNHLPGENDPVAGGMYPDDYDDAPSHDGDY